MRPVSIVCPLYNTRDEQVQMTYDCLDSIVKNTHIEYELIIVDDASTKKGDFSSYENTKIVRHRTNMGISRGWNDGIKKASYDAVCIINNDIIVYDGWLSNLVNTLPEDGIGFAFPTPVECEEDVHRRYYGTIFEDMVFGPCFLSTKQTYELLKDDSPGEYFDETFCPCFFEDYDMWERARKKGVPLRMTAKSFVKHIGHQTVDLHPQKQEIFDRNKAYLHKKHNKN